MIADVHVLPGDRIDASLALAGLRRADTPRLRALLEVTRRRVEPIVRARLAVGPLDGLAWSLRWVRRGQRWREVAAHDVEHREVPDERLELRRFAFSSIDSAACIRGPLEMLTGDVVRLAAVDWPRGTFAFDHLALVLDGGRLGPLHPCLPGRPGAVA